MQKKRNGEALAARLSDLEDRVAAAWRTLDEEEVERLEAEVAELRLVLAA